MKGARGKQLLQIGLAPFAPEGCEKIGRRRMWRMGVYLSCRKLETFDYVVGIWTLLTTLEYPLSALLESTAVVA